MMATTMGVVVGDPKDRHFTVIDNEVASLQASMAVLTTTYPGSGVGETFGVQTASTSTYGTTEAAMLQTLWNMARSMGLLA